MSKGRPRLAAGLGCVQSYAHAPAASSPLSASRAASRCSTSLLEVTSPPPTGAPARCRTTPLSLRTWGLLHCRQRSRRHRRTATRTLLLPASFRQSSSPDHSV
ncbi:hypothetical protein V5799_022127 [Amblyomma americanum]|uniref:Uncharacterized protein n=1 Tax=Amblyomma americanum TaxID=6943 RepID=A0AAQ4FLG9_AMBAM